MSTINHNLKMILATLATIVAASTSAMAAPMWSVHIDQNVAGTSSNNTSTVRALALSDDDDTLYSTWIQQSSTGRRVRSYDANIPNTLLNSYTTAAFGSAAPGRQQARSIATDDRGNVFYGSGDRDGETPYILALSANLGTQISGKVTTSDPATMAKRIGGADVRKVGSNYQLYIAREGGTGEAYVQRFDVTNAAAPVLDTTFNGTGTFNLASLGGFGTSGFPRGLEVADDGTIFLTSTTAGSSGGPSAADRLYKIAPDLTTVSQVAVLGAFDVALYGNKAFVTRYDSVNSDIAVINTNTMSLVETYSTGFTHSNVSTDSGYTGIDVTADGRLFVADQLYSASGGQFDRVFVSTSVVPEPTCIVMLGIATASVGFFVARRRRD